MPSFARTSSYPVVETVSGALRGYFHHETHHFFGIPYAFANRFEEPQPFPAWEGVRDASGYGYICPLLNQPKPSMELLVTHQFWPENEHCQYLNIWTRSIEPGVRKPVLVWLHGGGYSSGSSMEQVSYDGENLVREGDIVFVSLNHRLNVFGFLDLSSYGEKYKNSKNLGMADIVAALQWIHDNIALFGGDPDNVTIMGQSGGGGKVSVLGQIPAAAGLYHKAVIMSGITDQMAAASDFPPDEFVNGLCGELGIPEGDIASLSKTPVSLFINAVSHVSANMRAKGYKVHWCPTRNDWFLGYPLDDGFSEDVKTVPTIAGSVICEIAMSSYDQDRNSLSEEEKMAFIAQRYGTDNAQAIADAFRQAYPGHNILEANDIDLIFRPYTLDYVTKKAAVSSAPVYNYVVSKVFDFEDGRPAWHCSDIPFFFKNIDRLPVYQNDPDMKRIELETSGALLAFMKTGSPNGEGLPFWPEVTPEKRSTLLYDHETTIGENHDETLIRTAFEHAGDGTIPRGKPRAVFAEEEDDGRPWLY